MNHTDVVSEPEPDERAPKQEAVLPPVRRCARRFKIDPAATGWRTDCSLTAGHDGPHCPSGAMSAWDKQRVADVYIAAASAGQHPSRAVALVFGVTPGAARYRVKRTRAAGLIPPSAPRTNARWNPKVLAIAADLGVDASDVERAIMRVGGDVRITRSHIPPVTM